jgi:CheY-like chemotaxis protein
MAKIVFCEDEIMLQELFCLRMRSMEHKVYVASDGIEGLEIIEREKPDLILTDIAMPRCDGFELAKAVREHPDLATTPIIFVTAYAQTYDKAEAARYNPVDYLIKPFAAAYLRDTITAALMKHTGPDKT